MIDRPRLALLRQRTRAAHASIERVPGMALLVAPDLTLPHYVSVLQHMHAFLSAAEPAIAAALDGLPAAVPLLDGERPRALASDLAWLGAPPIAMTRPLPRLETPNAALGALYVVEGSSLGGRVIARHVTESLGMRPGAGGSFYGGLSAEAARIRWAALCDLIESSMSATDAERAAVAACETFACLEQWMWRMAVDQRPPSPLQDTRLLVAAVGT